MGIVKNTGKHTQGHYIGDKTVYYYHDTMMSGYSLHFDIMKRIARCRHKGQFHSDLQKVLDCACMYQAHMVQPIDRLSQTLKVYDEFCHDWQLNEHEVEILYFLLFDCTGNKDDIDHAHSLLSNYAHSYIV